MEQTEENNYKFIASDYLRQLDSDEEFYLVEKTTDLYGAELIRYRQVTVNEVRVTQAWNSYQMHADIDNITDPKICTRDIDKKQYYKFTQYKGNMRRLKLFLAVFTGTIIKRKEVASKHIDLRVTPEFYRVLDDGAKQCKQSLSRYCRDILKGKTPKAALSDEQYKMMRDLIMLRRDLDNFRSAMIDQLKRMPPEERTRYMVEGISMAKWRRYLQESIAILNKTYFNDI